MLSVSTKTGDQGTSTLANGQRVRKDELIFEVLGTQDELNSWLGVCIALLSSHFDAQKEVLFKIQETMFYIGAELAQSPKVKLSSKALTQLEEYSNVLQAAMEKDWTTKFLYPGGNQAAAWCDVARTVSRRLERLIVKYARETEVSPVILQYVNRLSDFMYVLRCYINSQEKYQEKKFENKSSD